MSILIKNGNIIEGTGKKMYRGDILIEKDRIKEIGNLLKARADKIIDASNLYVAPGFVDILNHSDSYWTLFNVPTFESILKQGVTSILVGNCGSSLAPIVEEGSILSIQKWADISEVNVNWLKMKEFLAEIEKRKISCNFATLVGHATLRRGLLKEELRNLTNEELDKMKYMLKEALEEGAFGLSSGLVYSHAKAASQDEISELAKIVKEYNGIFSIHLRNEAEEFLSSLNEVLSVTRATGVSTEISHFKVIGKEFWSQMGGALDMLEAASHNLNINFDLYPYLTIGSVMYIFLPDWAAKGGRKMLISRLKEPSIKERIIQDMKKPIYDYRKVIIAMSPADKTFIGKSISEIAENQGLSPQEAVVNMFIASRGHIIGFVKSLNEENLELSIKSDISFVASDGSGYDLRYIEKKELVHPRCFGAFPRFLGRFVRDKKLLSWEEAITKISSGPAEKIGLKNRGKIIKGYFADITIFDPQKIIDRASFKNPYKYPGGIEYVLVNGEAAVEKGELTDKMPGRVLRRA